MKVLAIDVGGSRVKILATGRLQPRKFPSGDKLTAERMVSEVRRQASDWEYEAVSLGLPAPSARTVFGPSPETWASAGSASTSPRLSAGRWRRLRRCREG